MYYRYGYNGNGGGGANAASSLVVDTFAAYAATSSVVANAGVGAAGTGGVPPYDTSNYVADSTTPGGGSGSTTSSAAATSTYRDPLGGGSTEVSSVAAPAPDNLIGSGIHAVIMPEILSSGEYHATCTYPKG